jgi:putative heme-binding domain-containing protein
MDDGATITGMITEENDKVVKVVVDPLAKDTATVLQKDEVEERVKSAVSMMPKGLLDRLSREEILDLIAYVYAKGDPKNMLFSDHAHHNN